MSRSSPVLGGYTLSPSRMVPNYNRRRRGSPYAEFAFGFSRPGSLATFAAIRHASSLLSSLAADRRPGSSS